ncbi:hypothetical protein P261_01407 [Lachnospiraceae bacterium TWA4]|nr:hypothetical protein P261_01407 [Lachnospiraceae bacterium TWA4]
MYKHRNQGTCSSNVVFDVEDGLVKSVEFEGGCQGNLKGISKLVEGMKIDDVIERLQGVTCGYKPTSCPDQLARALKAYKEKYDA